MFDGSAALPYCALNFPIHVHAVDGASRDRIHVKPRLSSTSPLLLRMEDSNDDDDDISIRSRRPEPAAFPPASGRDLAPLDSPNSVGVLGGLSAASTLRFLKKLDQWGPRHGLPFVACSDPMLAKGRRTTQIVRSIAAESLRTKRLYLERSGARCIAMPCYVAQAWRDEIAEGCSVPFLDAGECVAEELKAANLKPVEMGSNVRVGVLAVDASEVGQFYQWKLEIQGFEVLLPDKATMEHIVIPAMDAFDRKDTEGARNLLRISIQALLVRAVSSIILASDYMNGLLPEDDPLLRKCIDPMDALVRATLLWAASVNHGK